MKGAVQNRQIVLARYPQGAPVAADFALTLAPTPTLGVDQVLVRTHYLSMDPFLRLQMDANVTIAPPLPLGAVVIGRGVGRVAATTSAAFSVGDYVAGELGWRDYAVCEPGALRRVDPDAGPLQTSLGVLGPSGLAAHLALFDEGQPRPGETVLVSAAAGAVGSIAGQLARLHGCTVIGACLGREQVEYVHDELRFDAAVDVQGIPELSDALRAACPRGIDVFLDSVGGEMHNAVVAQMNTRGRVVVFGYISAYNAPAGQAPEYGRIHEVLRRRLRVSGFLLSDHAARFAHAAEEIAGHYRAGRVSIREHVTRGLERAPEAFAALFAAAPPGKQLVQVADEGE